MIRAAHNEGGLSPSIYSNGKSYYPWNSDLLSASVKIIKTKNTFVCSCYLLVCILDILSLKYTNCLGTRQYFTMWCFDIRFRPIFLRVTRAAIIRLTVPHARPNAGQFSYYYQDIKYNFWSDWQPSACVAGPGLPEYRGPGALKLLIGDMFVSDNIFVTSAVFYDDAVSFVICEPGRF